jgi:hypothetical protein
VRGVQCSDDVRNTAVRRPQCSNLPGGAARRPRPVHDAEHQLQMVRELGSPSLMHLRDDASAAQRAADASGLVLHALVVLPRPENRRAIGHGDAHVFPDRVRVFSRERENIGQEGFNALVHRAVAALLGVEFWLAAQNNDAALRRAGWDVMLQIRGSG